MEISKKQIKNDILKILECAEIDKKLWEKILNPLVNYTHKTAKQSMLRQIYPPSSTDVILKEAT
jgi:hypothetical protein